MRLEGKVAIVTGGAQGIGRAIATLFHKEGAKVLIADIQDKGLETAKEIAGDSGEVIFRKTDVAEESENKAMVEAAVAAFGKLDIIINNAWSGRNAPVTQLTAEDWNRGIAVGLSATVWSAKYGVPEMIKVGGGAIVSIASVHGIQASAGCLPYEPVKGGLIHLVKELAVELGPHNIRVNAISPGWIITEVAEPNVSEQRRWFYSQNYPLRHPGKPINIAYAALFLASDEAEFITGHNLVVDGGMTVWLNEDMATHLARQLKDRPQPWW